MKALLTLSAILTVVFGQCPDSTWTLLSDQKRCIKVFPTPLIMDEAWLMCYLEKNGIAGALNSVLSTADNAQLATVAKRDGKGYTQFWIGFRRAVDTKQYFWNDGSPVSYTNWKPGSNPNSTSYDCVIFDTTSSYWIPNTRCTPNTYPYICQVPAHEHDFRYLIVGDGIEDYVITEGFASKKTVQAFSSTYIVLPLTTLSASHQVYVKMKYYANANATIRFIDQSTETEIKSFGDNWRWESVEFATHAWFVRMQSSSTIKGALAYNITFGTQPLFCPAEFITIGAGTKRNIQTFGYDRTELKDRLLSPYSCQKILQAPSGYNIYLTMTAYAGANSYINITDHAKGTRLLRLMDNRNWFTMKNFNTYAENVKVEGASSALGEVGFSIDCAAAPKKCQEKTYNAALTTQAFSTPEYPMNLSDFSCTSMIKGGGASTRLCFKSTTFGFSGDGRILITNADTGAKVSDLISIDGSNKETLTNFCAGDAKNVKIQATAGKQGYVFYNIQYYYEKF